MEEKHNKNQISKLLLNNFMSISVTVGGNISSAIVVNITRMDIWQWQKDRYTSINYVQCYFEALIFNIKKPFMAFKPYIWSIKNVVFSKPHSLMTNFWLM